MLETQYGSDLEELGTFSLSTDSKNIIKRGINFPLFFFIMVIISSLHNYDIDDIHTFNQSLNSVGYSGEKIMIVYNCKDSVKTYLKNSGWIIYQKNLDDTQVVTKRFEDISDILKEYNNDEYVLVTDCRDVYFNKNIELFNPIDLYIGVDGNYPLKNHICIC